jgi:hypothetical protein
VGLRAKDPIQDASRRKEVANDSFPYPGTRKPGF